MARTQIKARTQVKDASVTLAKLGDDAGGTLLNVANTADAPNNWTIGTGAVTLNVGTLSSITGLTSSPAADNEAASKGYVDSVATGLDVKASVAVASTANVPLTNVSAVTVDGIALADGDRVLLKNQTVPTENGIYSYNGTTFDFTRSADADNTPLNEVSGGMFTFVEQGTQASTGWVMTSPVGNAVLGTDNLVFAQFSGSGTYSASNGVQLVGNDFSLNLDTNSGLSLTGNAVSVGNTDSTLTVAGSNVSVNTTTLAGTGLTANGTALDLDAATVAGTGLTGTGTTLSLDSTTIGGSGLTYSAGALSVNAGAGLAVNVDSLDVQAADNSITVNTNDIQVNVNAAGGLWTDASGLRAKLNVGFGAPGTIQPLAVSSDGLFVNVDSDTIVSSLAGQPQGTIKVNVKLVGGIDTVGGLSVITDGTSLEINGTNQLQVVAAGIDQTHIDFGTGLNQVSAVDVPVGAWGGVATNVLTALTELDGRVDAIGGSSVYGVIASASTLTSATFAAPAVDAALASDVRVYINGERLLAADYSLNATGNLVVTFNQNAGDEWEIEADDVVFIDYNTTV